VFLYGEDALVEEFVALNIEGCSRGFGECVTIGVLKGDTLVAGLVYHNWQPEAGVMELSVASTTPTWLTRPVLKEMFGFPFERCDCQLVICRTSEAQTRLHRLLKALGFTKYRIPRLRGRDAAELVWTLTDDIWNASKFAR
jgi:RimJ/RimL family protein N-acetyltransferase